MMSPSLVIRKMLGLSVRPCQSLPVAPRHQLAAERGFLLPGQLLSKVTAPRLRHTHSNRLSG